MSSLEALPPSVFDHICGFLDKPSLRNFGQTNRYTNYLGSQQQTWKDLYYSLHPGGGPIFLESSPSAKVPVVGPKGIPAAALRVHQLYQAKPSKEDRDYINWKSLYVDSKVFNASKWKLSQVFGEDPTSVNQGKENVITTVEFDSTGKYLSIGYQCGQVVVFRNTEKETYKFYTQFESHHPEFDFLTSLEIEEKINKIKWAKNKYGRDSRLLLTTNDKTIKMWKMLEKRKPFKPGGGAEVSVLSRKVYANAHAYNIHSMSHCSDGELFISADDLRINLWNVEVGSEGFTVVDSKPENMNELNEVITSAEFHPTECQSFIWSTSKGLVNMADMRQQALCDRTLRCFRDKEGKKSFFSDIVAAISDVKFSHDGRFILARDFLKLKIWDVRMEAEPVKSFSVQPHVKSKLYELYENDCIFDKFECGFSANDLHVVSGSYSNNLAIFDLPSEKVQYLQAINPRDRNRKRTELPSTDLKFNEKISHLAWHPHGNLMAIAAGNYIYLYTLPRNG